MEELQVQRATHHELDALLPLFAGYDLLRRTGRLWSFDVTGGWRDRYRSVK